MKIRNIFWITALCSLAMAACTPDEKDPKEEEKEIVDDPVDEPTPTPDPIPKPTDGTKLAAADVLDPMAKFPVLETTAQADVYKQQKSAKRGVSTNFKVVQMAELMRFGVSWCYDWSSVYNPGRWELLRKADMIYEPMGWNETPAVNVLKNNKNAGSSWLLGFNEPNLTDQANLTPAQAAPLWRAMVEAAQGANLRLVSPAMSWGTMKNYEDPEVWMDDFLRQQGVSLDQMDAIAGHAYMPNTAGVKAFARKFTRYGKPFWLTEFCHANGPITTDQATQIAFLSEIITWLEGDPAIKRYSWFMDTGLGEGGGDCSLIDWGAGRTPKLTPLGVLYNSASSLDKETHYSAGENIPAEHYSGSSATAFATADQGWTKTVVPIPTTDTAGTLDIGFGTACWVEYEVDLPVDGTFRLDVRYAAPRPLAITLTTPWIEDQTVTYAATGGGSTWTTAGVPVAMLSGRQTIRLACSSGVANINWIRLTRVK